MCLLAWWLWRMRDAFRPGVLLAFYLFFSGLERLLVEFVRRNEPVLAGLTEAQLLSLRADARGVDLARTRGALGRAAARGRRRGPVRCRAFTCLSPLGSRGGMAVAPMQRDARQSRHASFRQRSVPG